MKLLNIITLRFALLATLIMAFWSVLFYYEIINELNDEVDDSLEDYAEMIVIRHVRNNELPTASSGSNNQFYIKEVSQEYANSHKRIKYEDRNVFIEEKGEFEPARVLTYIYENDEDKFYEIEVSTPNIDKDDLKKDLIYWLIFLLAAILLSILLINTWTLKHTMRPLKNLLEWLGIYKVGEENKPLDNPTRIYEFQTLNKAVQESINRTEEAYRQQKLFVGNASHEMQTPIAICNSRLELLMQDSSLTEKQLEEIIKTKHTLEQLSRMNRSLLLLTKIENRQFSSMSEVSLGDILKKIAPDYQMVYASKEISLRIEEKGKFVAKMDESLAGTLVSNLLKNAFVHNIPNGQITVYIGRNSIIFENTGEDSPLDKDLIFDAFYHTPSNLHSSGLGLPIVKAICKSNGLNLNYSFINQKHQFTINKK